MSKKTRLPEEAKVSSKSSRSVFRSENNECLSPKEVDILERCRRFFSSNIKYVKEMLGIINGESLISIRVIDWFVSNYSKKNNTMYRIRVNGVEKIFNVNSDYKNQLGGYSKQYFDPFCRKKKLIYRYRNPSLEKTIVFKTSIGQLNFFQWAIRSKVIVYVLRHLEEIDQDMKQTTRANRERKRTEPIESDESEEEDTVHEIDREICSSDIVNRVVIGGKKKPTKKRKTRRQQLSHSPYEKGIRMTHAPITIDFD